MALPVPVLVRWTTGKISRPTGGYYSTEAAFAGYSNWPEESWSITLGFSPPEEALKDVAYATAQFLSQEAPHELLCKGASFEMREGAKVTASVQVL